MEILQKQENLVIYQIEDFVLSQILECGQCFNFIKTGEEEYDVIAYGRAVHIKQEKDVLTFYNTDIEEYKRIWQNYFDIERDYDSIKKAVIKADKNLKKAIDAKRGIRILNQDFFETLISFIISQNKQIPQIKQVIRNISHNFGEEIIGYNGEVYYTFPSPEKLNQVSEEELRMCKTGFRAPYIKDAVKHVCDGSVTEEILKGKSVDEARQLLMTIKGVGEKVANCVLLFGLSRREAFPVDVWMKRIMEEMYFGGQDTKKTVIEAYAMEKFGEYGGYAQQYLFDYARNNL